MHHLQDTLTVNNIPDIGTRIIVLVAIFFSLSILFMLLYLAKDRADEKAGLK